MTIDSIQRLMKVSNGIMARITIALLRRTL